MVLGIIATGFTCIGQIMRLTIAANPIGALDIFKVLAHTLWGGALATAIFLIVERFGTAEDFGSGAAKASAKSAAGAAGTSANLAASGAAEASANSEAGAAGVKELAASNEVAAVRGRRSGFRDFVTAFLVITVAALPMLIVYYPGMLLTDAYIEMQYASGMQAWIAHFSVPMDVFLYKLVSAGSRILGNDNAAFFVYTGLQFVAQTVVFSYTYAFICKVNPRRFVRISSLAFFALNTVIRIWGYTMGKDTIYAAALLLLIVAVLDAEWRAGQAAAAVSREGVGEKEASCEAAVSREGIDESEASGEAVGSGRRSGAGHRVLDAALIVGAAFLVAILRKNGIYVLVGWAVIGFIASKTQKWRYVAIAGAVLAAIFVNKWFVGHYNVAPGYVREALSVPIQQTARYIKYYGDELTEDDKQTLSSVFYVPLDEISDLYDPEASDNVKFCFKENPTDEEMKRYFSTWWKMLWKHPWCYVEAFVSNTYAYFDLTKVSDFGGTLGVYDIGEAYDWSGRLNYNFSHNPKFEGARAFIKNLHNVVAKLPIIGIFSCCGIYTYLLMFEFVHVIRRKRFKDLVMLLPIFLSLVFCLLSPVNGLMRYMLPMMMCTPVMIAWCGRGSGEEPVRNVARVKRTRE